MFFFCSFRVHEVQGDFSVKSHWEDNARDLVCSNILGLVLNCREDDSIALFFLFM